MKTLIVYQAPWNWTFLWNRSQPLACALSTHATVLYVNSDVDEARSLVARVLRKVPVIGDWALRKVFPNYIEKLSETLLVYHWRGTLGGYFISLQDRPVASYEPLRSEIQLLAKMHSKTWLLTSRPATQKLVGLHDWDKIIVDVEDPWFELTWGRKIPRKTIIDLLAVAGTVFANGPAIAKEYSCISSREVVSLPNGIDSSFLERLKQEQMLPVIFRNSHETRVVFTGNMNNRIDVAMVVSVVKSCPEATFYFVGRTERGEINQAFWDKLTSLDNFCYVSQVAHSSIPAILNHASALLLPYSDWGSKLMFPAKLYEYIASGRPIISTLDFDLGPVRPPTFRVCTKVSDVVEAVNDVVYKRWSVSSIDRDLCRQLAEANTWEGRAQFFCDTVAQAHTLRSGILG